MTEEKKSELYALLVEEVKALQKDGHRITRFGVLKILDGWFDQFDRTHIEMAEKLYADGIVDE